MESKVTDIAFKKKRHIPTPECPVGWCVAEVRDIDDADLRTASGFYIPTGAESAMAHLPEEARRKPVWYRVIATSKQYPINATTIIDTPFEVGDEVLVELNAKVRAENIAHCLPENAIAIWIAHVCAWQKLQTYPLPKKGES